jgi:hypothetical protein
MPPSAAGSGTGSGYQLEVGWQGEAGALVSAVYNDQINNTSAPILQGNTLNTDEINLFSFAIATPYNDSEGTLDLTVKSHITGEILATQTVSMDQLAGSFLQYWDNGPPANPEEPMLNWRIDFSSGVSLLTQTGYLWYFNFPRSPGHINMVTRSGWWQQGTKPRSVTMSFKVTASNPPPVN